MFKNRFCVLPILSLEKDIASTSDYKDLTHGIFYKEGKKSGL
jgi:hypothetical protein